MTETVKRDPMPAYSSLLVSFKAYGHCVSHTIWPVKACIDEMEVLVNAF